MTFTNLIEQSAQIGRKRGGQAQALPGNGMGEREGPGVKRRAGDQTGLFDAVEEVAGQRTAERGHVNPNLMGPAGLQLQLHQGAALSDSAQAVAGAGWLAV